jgi:signal peptidase I
MRTYDHTRTFRRGELGLESPDVLDYARHELSQRRNVQLRMSGSSMRPGIDDGDIVTIAPFDETGIVPQDIVLISTPSKTALIHRVISMQMREGSLVALTRADHSRVADTPVPVDRILGYVVAIQPQGRSKAILVRRPSSLLSRLRLVLRRMMGRSV